MNNLGDDKDRLGQVIYCYKYFFLKYKKVVSEKKDTSFFMCVWNWWNFEYY